MIFVLTENAKRGVMLMKKAACDQCFCFVILTVQKIKRIRGGSSFLMKDMKNICKVVLVQAEPVLFDKEASLKKVLNYIDEPGCCM